MPILSTLLALAILPHPATTPQSGELPRRGVLGVSFAPVPADVRSKLSLSDTEGAVAVSPVAGLTADKAGLKTGDIILSVNGMPVVPATIGATVRTLPANKPVKFAVVRDEKRIELTTNLVERPRDPGNANYKVVYSHITSHGHKMRTIITLPTKPGKHPGVFFIQGFSPVSYDFTLEGSKGDVSTLDGPILFDLANSGFVTMRVEKPGVGDSEGGPFAEMDYTTELDIYRQALKQLKEQQATDIDNVFIFGHSMGGAFGPMVAAENHVKGIAVYGVASRTWFEYLMDTIRYQGLVGGASFEQADNEARAGARVMALVMLENKAPSEVKVSHPELAEFVDAYFPGGLFNGKSLDFWRQLGQINFPEYWSKCDAHVLAVRGISDFVTYDVDHKLIADVVNRKHPGWGKSMTIPDSDHLFHAFPTEQKSMLNFSKGTFSPVFIKVLRDWISEVMAS